ncbi:MAG: serine O-acetyltransferase [Armatimonadota bacterium]
MNKNKNVNTCSELQTCIEKMHIEDSYLNKLPAVVREIAKDIGTEASPDHVGYPMIPSSDSMKEIVAIIETILYPGYFGEQEIEKSNVEFYLGNQINRLYKILSRQFAKCLMHNCMKSGKKSCTECADAGKNEALKFIKKIPEIRKTLWGDIKAAYIGDPAAKGYEEIIFCYPGLKAISIYRAAHQMHIQSIPFLPRMMCEYAHANTGCDIHPGAKIGDNFFIDHATGVVIGETTVIGKNVRIYQGVTLGSLRFPKDKNGNIIRDKKRHPTIEDEVIIYANATILGGETVIGKGSIIGGNVWITESVPPHSRVVVEPEHQKITVK